MKAIRLTRPGPNTENPEIIARWIYSQIGEMLQRTEWIGQLTEESAKLGVFEEPIWTRDQRRLAKKLRSFYAHDVQRIDHKGTVHFYNIGRKKGPKETKKELPQLLEDFANMHNLVHETLVCYSETTIECQTCGLTSHGKNLPDCGHCVAPLRSSEREPVVMKPQGATLSIGIIAGRSDTIDEFTNERRKMTIADGGWQTMMETGKFPHEISTLKMGDNVIPEDQKPQVLRESWPISPA